MIEEKKIKLDFLGGAMEVGASCILVEIAGYRVLLDAGIRQKTGLDPLPDIQRIQECGGIDAIIVSHAHMDHTGTLPIVSKAYPEARIYTTSMTIDLVRVLLLDSIKLMNRQEEGIPMYAQKDVEGMMGRMLAVHYEQPLEILPGLTLTLYQAGHIAGAACIFMESKDGSLFYSGDFSGFSQNAIEGMRIPKLRPDVTIIESTYGDRLHANRQIEEERLIEAVRECIEEKGKMIIPAFALGRSQEILLILRKAINKGMIPDVKIYVDGMVRDMNIAFERNPWYLKNALAKRIEKGNSIFYSDNVLAVSNKENREELLRSSDPVVFVSSSGMLTGGPSVTYAEKIVQMENGYLAITGYQDEEAPGRMVQQLLEDTSAERYLTINGKRIPVKGKLRKIGLSAHGDQSEIQNVLERLSSRNVFLVHGDAAVIEQLSKTLELDYRTRIYTPKDGDSETVYLKSPRQQWKKTYPYTMQKDHEFGESDQDGAQLYQYWKDHYQGQKYTIGELAYIWSGRYGQSNERLELFQKNLISENYFDRDTRRLFLFVCKSEEEIEKACKKEEWNQQTLFELAQKMFAEYHPRKVGYYGEKKEIALQIDFPGLCKEEYEELVRQYKSQTGWQVVRNENPNEQAMKKYLYEKIDGNISKIAIHRERKMLVVTVTDNSKQKGTEQQIREEFRELTGFELVIQCGEKSEQFDGVKLHCEDHNNRLYFIADTTSNPVEQNLAFSCIDKEFESAEHQPYKKGIKNDEFGKYIELSFLSPKLGLLESERVERLCKQIGWRIKISDSVNQNEIQQIVMKVCFQHGITLIKTPSYQPLKRCIVVKADIQEKTDADLIQKVKNLLTQKIGIDVLFM